MMIGQNTRASLRAALTSDQAGLCSPTKIYAACCLRIQNTAYEFFFPAFFTFPLQKAHFPQTPSHFPHMTFQSLVYVMKRAAAFRVCPPGLLDWLGVLSEQ